MIDIIDTGEIQEDQMKSIYQEWVQVANRLKKGEGMLNQTRSTFVKDPFGPTKVKYEKLSNLYNFLVKVNSVYDDFFRTMLPKDEHQRLQRGVLEILTN